MISLLFLMIILSNFMISHGQTYFCPSILYTYCATEGEYCSIPDTIDEGYMSYGWYGKYILVPFTNDHTDFTDSVIACSVHYGDIYSGSTKYCCYIAANIGIYQEYYTGYKIQNDGYWDGDIATATTTWGMRYGTGSRFTYRIIEGTAAGWCNDEFFNDAAYGNVKHCNYCPKVPASIPIHNSSLWISCANTGQWCTGLDTGAAQWVKYGSGGQYYLKLVISSIDGQIPCVDELFHDPRIGYMKYCYKAPAQYTFETVVGQWGLVLSCIGYVHIIL